MRNSKKFKKMSRSQIHTEKRRALSEPFSDFARFSIDTEGLKFIDKQTGSQVYKWEIFNTFNATERLKIIEGKHVRYEAVNK